MILQELLVLICHYSLPRLENVGGYLLSIRGHDTYDHGQISIIDKLDMCLGLGRQLKRGGLYEINEIFTKLIKSIYTVIIQEHTMSEIQEPRLAS